MFLESLKISTGAVLQIFILAAVGYFLVRRNLLGAQGLSYLSRLLIEVILPVFIFFQLIQNFSFSLYPDWWIFPLMSIAITTGGLLLGGLFSAFIKGRERKWQFLSLITFQNSGYLPLALVAAILPKDKSDTMFIYLFLFLIGFNLLVWSLGVYMLISSRTKRFEMANLFSPPVIAALSGLIFVFLGFNRFIPDIVIKPFHMIGECTLPLAMFIVGGNLAEMKFKGIDSKSIFLVIVAKMLIMPLIGLWLVSKFKFSEIMGLFILIQLMMPPATSLSLITRHYHKEDILVSQGIFLGHILSIITIPLFLSLYLLSLR